MNGQDKQCERPLPGRFACFLVIASIALSMTQGCGTSETRGSSPPNMSWPANGFFSLREDPTKVNPDIRVIDDYSSLYVEEEHPPNEIRPGYVPIIAPVDEGNIYGCKLPTLISVYELRPVVTTRSEIQELATRMGVPGRVRFVPGRDGDPREDSFTVTNGSVLFTYRPCSGSLDYYDSSARDPKEGDGATARELFEYLVKTPLLPAQKCFEITFKFFKEHNMEIPGTSLVAKSHGNGSVENKGKLVDVQDCMEVSVEGGYPSEYRYDRKGSFHDAVRRWPDSPDIRLMIPRSGRIESISGHYTRYIQLGTYRLRSVNDAIQDMREGRGFVCSQGDPGDEIKSVGLVLYSTVIDGNRLVTVPVYRFSGETAEVYTLALEHGPQIRLYFPDPPPNDPNDV